jgi:hypothetical protein
MVREFHALLVCAVVFLNEFIEAHEMTEANQTLEEGTRTRAALLFARGVERAGVAGRVPQLGVGQSEQVFQGVLCDLIVAAPKSPLPCVHERADK